MKGLGNDRLWREMHSPFLLLSGKIKFNYWFAVLRGKVQQNFEALLQNDSVKDSLSIHER